jgi:hypothetical protein
MKIFTSRPSDDTTARFGLDDVPCPELARDLVVGLAELIHPHGTVDAAGSVNHYARSIRHLARTLAARGFAGGAADLRRTQMAEYWMATSGPKEACTHRMLHGFQLAGGHLDTKLAELAAGRAYNPQRNHHQLPPYPEDQWEQLTQTCRRVVDESFTRHKAALAAARHGRHPRDHGWSEDNLGWLLAGSVRSASSPSGSTWAVRTTWSASAAGCWKRARTCSLGWML